MLPNLSVNMHISFGWESHQDRPACEMHIIIEEGMFQFQKKKRKGSGMYSAGTRMTSRRITHAIFHLKLAKVELFYSLFSFSNLVIQALLSFSTMIHQLFQLCFLLK